jgi:N-methylhydantoinase B
MPDAVRATVIAHRLDAIAEHMADATLRTARSPIFQIRDFVTGIFTGDGHWIATKDYIPVLAGSMPSAWEAVNERFGGDVHDGDAFLLNDPFRGNNHAPDMTVLAPIFYDSELRFWVLSKGHHIDVGAASGGFAGVNPAATTVWDEALRIPPVRIVSGRRIVRDLWELVLLNIRMREMTEGDLRCQLGALAIGERELLELLEHFGAAPVAEAVGFRLEASRRHMAAEIAAIPDGSYFAERFLDSGGRWVTEPIRIALQVTVSGERVCFDFTGSDAQVAGFVNSTYANTVASCMIGLFSVLDPTIERNSGSLGQINVVAPLGSIVNAREPAATYHCTLITCETIIEAIWLALADAMASGTQAGWSRAGGIGMLGRDEARGDSFLFSGAPVKGGAGAVSGADGWHGLGTAVAMGGTQSTDPEIAELSAPIAIDACELVCDSAGAGRWRGGAGVRVVYSVHQDGVSTIVTFGGMSALTAPFGLRGGFGSSPCGGEIRHRDGRIEPLSLYGMPLLDDGDVVEIRISGGGGFGDPTLREPEEVAGDVSDGIVSFDAAREIYRVVLDGETLRVDIAATAALRSA